LTFFFKFDDFSSQLLTIFFKFDDFFKRFFSDFLQVQCGVFRLRVVSKDVRKGGILGKYKQSGTF